MIMMMPSEERKSTETSPSLSQLLSSSLRSYPTHRHVTRTHSHDGGISLQALKNENNNNDSITSTTNNGKSSTILPVTMSMTMTVSSKSPSISKSMHNPNTLKLNNNNLNNLHLNINNNNSNNGSVISNSNNQPNHPSHNNNNVIKRDYAYQQFMLGLNIAGVASSMLVTVYGLFYVDVFLRAYDLPVSTYSSGNIIFAIINTANDFLGAWFLDSAAQHIPRSDMIGVIGVLFSLMFLAPFFRWSSSPTSAFMNGGIHFVLSVSAYDTFYSFTAILLGSLVTDNHTMNDQERIWFMASGKIINLLAAFVVARIGLAVFDTKNLYPFRLYLICLAVIVASMFVLAQILTRYRIVLQWKKCHFRFLGDLKKSDDEAFFLMERWTKGITATTTTTTSTTASAVGTADTTTTTTKSVGNSSGVGGSSTNNHLSNATNKNVNGMIGNNNKDLVSVNKQQKQQQKQLEKILRPRQVLHDFWRHQNFWAWIGMEIFLESQVSFCNVFLKTFMDRLVYDRGDVSREVCDWLLSVIRPFGLILGILCYIPIRQFGYQRVYPILFAANATFSLIIYTTANHTSTNMIIAFLMIYPALTSAVMSSGFHLVMSDMVLEMKKRHASEGRWDEPSLAGLFMGINALFCKPAESFLPVVAGHMLSRFDLNSEEPSEDVQKVLFQVLVIPPLLFSLVQWASWSCYTLTPGKTSQMREELQHFQTHRRYNPYVFHHHQNQQQHHLYHYHKHHSEEDIL